MTSQTASAGWNFDNTYARLPESLRACLNPVRVQAPEMAVFNPALAEALGLNPEALQADEGLSTLAGNQIPEGAEPLAQAYAGHQFGNFTMLGDGRAILLGEHQTPDGKRVDIQLKGSGQTPFSRRGDGRAALGPMLREYLISEAMHALGIPTTRSLAVVTTGEPVYRETTLPGAILTRVASSHIRVGTFEYVAARGSREDLRTLADYTLKRHYPEAQETDNPHQALLEGVMERQAALIAKWQGVGFIHGVMNTDNMALSGETIDYGPCAFMDRYNPATVFSSIDVYGRYAYGNQPTIAHWNLARFTEALLPLLHPEQEQALELGQEILSSFPERFQRHWLAAMRAKLGLLTPEADDTILIQALLDCMQNTQQDFTNTFRTLTDHQPGMDAPFKDPDFMAWYAAWQTRLQQQEQPQEAVQQSMQAHNPAVIPRNHRVEEALRAAVDNNDYAPFHTLLKLLQDPFADLAAEYADYRQPAPLSDTPYKTFCGT